MTPGNILNEVASRCERSSMPSISSKGCVHERSRAYRGTAMQATIFTDPRFGGSIHLLVVLLIPLVHHEDATESISNASCTVFVNCRRKHSTEWINGRETSFLQLRYGPSNPFLKSGCSFWESDRVVKTKQHHGFVIEGARHCEALKGTYVEGAPSVAISIVPM